jgi:AAA domain
MNSLEELLVIKGVPISRAATGSGRFTALIWGPSGGGKTTLACTAPGRKLIVNFDPDGPDSVAYRNDTDVLDYSTRTYGITETFKSETEPLGLTKAVLERYDTIIVDSITNASDKALDAGVASSLVKGSHMERPAPGSYQFRNRLTLKLVKNVLRITGQHGKHCIFIGHEDSPTKTDEGTVLFVSVALGGSLPDSVPIDFSEVWGIYEVPGKGKHLAIRPCRSRKPMKTRLFSTDKEPEFPLTYNPITGKGDTISRWWEMWIINNKNKIPIPGSREYEALLKNMSGHKDL